MPEICRFYGIIIRMFFRDHNPPHFHAEYQGERACFAIDTLALIEGDLPRRARLLVTEWALDHQAELLQNWEKAQLDVLIAPILPLP